MICHDWLGPKHLAVGTKTGKVLVLEDAELRSTVDVYELVQKAAIISMGGIGSFLAGVAWQMVA